MNWNIRQTDSHAYSLEFNSLQTNDKRKVMLLSDLHWDSMDCDRELLKRDLDEAKSEGIPVLLIGDTFDVMQGKFDKRKSAKALRPEHREENYIDVVIDDAISWFEPYKDVLALVTKGNHECVDEDTEVLTKRGWIKASDVKIDDLVFNIHPHTNEGQWCKPIKLHSYDFDGDMCFANQRGISMNVTPNHRVAYFKHQTKSLSYCEAGSISGNTVIPVASSLNNPELEGYSDDEIMLSAWLLTDGNYSNGKYFIYQSKENMIVKIRQLLDRMKIDFVETTRNREPDGIKIKSAKQQHIFKLNKNLEYLVGTMPKKIPLWVNELSNRQFKIFLETYIDGDGTRRKNAYCIYGKEEILEDLQITCVTHNYRCQMAKRNRNVNHPINGMNGYWCLNVTERQTATLIGSKIKKNNYKGKVYCLTMPSGNFMVRRNGFPHITGNSSWEKYHDTDICSRFVAGMKRAGSRCLLGKYWGFVHISLLETKKHRASKTLFFHHGAGGGGEITRGLIDNSRTRGMYIADAYISGHIHRRNLDENIVYQLNSLGSVEAKQQLFLRSSTYKVEDDGYHVEKGRGPRPLGGWWLEIRYHRRSSGIDCNMRAYQT